MMRRPLLCLALALTAVLGVMFARSFHPDYLAFSNDGPFGLMSAYSEIRWNSFLNGSWLVLNWVGGVAPSLTPAFQHLFFLIAGPVGFSKFVEPASLLALGLAAGFWAKRMKFHPWVCVLVGFAAALNSNFFSYACWGLPTRASTLAAVFLVLAAMTGLGRGRGRDWLWTIVVGFAVGQVVVEGADVGAIFSLVVAAFIVFQSLTETGSTGRRMALGLGRVALVAVCAAWLATHTLTTLVSTQVKGVAILQETPESRQQRWDFITGISFPKIETLRLIIPGLLGYRMDTPGGGEYWGTVGFDGTFAGRNSGGGEYAGVLVVLVAAWALARSLGREKQPFTGLERKTIWFWGGLAVVSLLLAFGRFAPFFQVVFHLPYLSTIRIPMKYLHVFHLCLLILFAYGLQGIWRQYLEVAVARRGGLGNHLKTWWRGVPAFDRRWWIGAGAFGLFSVFGAIIYTASSREVERYLTTVLTTPGSDAQAAAQAAGSITSFSLHEVWLYLLVLAASLGALVLVATGWFTGARARTAFALLAVILVADLVRANTPWVRHYDYRWRYQSNPVVDFLKEKPQEHRVTARWLPSSQLMFTAPNDTYFRAIHNRWLENHFQRDLIQTLDLIQAPRFPELDNNFIRAFTPTATNLQTLPRLWELTNTRYVLGARGFEGQFNGVLDPQKKRFKVVQAFELTPKPGVTESQFQEPDSHTAVATPNGQYAIFEFDGALPRTQLFTRWQVITNDAEALQRLSDPSFDPHTALVVDEAINASQVANTTAAAAANITSYSPTRLRIQTKSVAPGVLLLNERWHPDWTVAVDGKAAGLLRCNYLMRGVEVPAGEHSVEFHYKPKMTTLYVSLAALACALGLCGFLATQSRSTPLPAESSPEAAKPAAPPKASSPSVNEPSAKGNRSRGSGGR
jgi:hypothetical protein